MIVLGIESSCDETAAALVREDGTVLCDVVRSQVALHAAFGGVVPELASRAHLSAIGAVMQEALSAAPDGLASVDAIAVTAGPGLAGALLVGASAAKALAWATGKPLVGVSHLDAHLLAVQLRRSPADSPVPYPYVALLVSGGHTALYRVDSPLAITMLGQTRDDAAGEAFDKAAKLLGLGYPGGPLVDRLAALGDARAVAFPAPMQSRSELEFSFAGLKTALARWIEREGAPADDSRLADVCASYQRVLVESLVKKSLAACEREGVRRLVLTGGVAANRGLRELARARAEGVGVELHVPPFASCTDNAAMVAYAGIVKLLDPAYVPAPVLTYTRDAGRRRGRFDREGKLLPASRPR